MKYANNKNLTHVIFGQHEPGKTSKGKTSEEEIYYEFLRRKLQQKIQVCYSQLISSLAASSP
jgi:hypothetical protein